MARPRLFIEIDPVTHRKLILWAKTRGEKKTTWARIILTLRCDENEPKVKMWYEAEAKRLGITVEELETAVLKEENFDFEQYRLDLIGGENKENS